MSLLRRKHTAAKARNKQNSTNTKQHLFRPTGEFEDEAACDVHEHER